MAPYGRRLPWFEGGNTSIPCRGFGLGFGIFVKMAKMAKSGQTLCIGWGFGPVLAFLSFFGQNSLRV